MHRTQILHNVGKKQTIFISFIVYSVELISSVFCVFSLLILLLFLFFEYVYIWTCSAFWDAVLEFGLGVYSYHCSIHLFICKFLG